MNIISPQKTIDKFNEMFPVGSKCHWRNVGQDGVPYTEMTVEQPAYNLHGQAVVFFVERRSCCSVDTNFVYYPKEQKL